MRIPLKRYLSLLAQYLKPHWPRIVLMTLFFLVDLVLQLVNPRLLSGFMDGLVHKSPGSTLLTLAVLFFSFAIINQVAAILGNYLSSSIAWDATNRLRRDLLTHCLHLDMSYHKAHTAGEMIERVDGDVNLLSSFFSEMLVNLFINVFFLFGLLFMLFTIHWLVGITVVLFTAMLIGVQMYLRVKTVPLWIQLREMSSALYGFVGERLSGTEDIRANGATSYILRRFLLLLRQWFPTYKKMTSVQSLMGLAMFFLMNIGGVIFVGVGAYLLSTKSISIGTVFLITTYGSLISYPIWRLQSVSNDLQQAEACITRTEELLHTQSQLADGPGCTFPDGALAVDFEHITFGYTEDKPVLHDLTLHVPEGSVLGIVGRTGSGKTSLARLIFRMYDVQQGEVHVGGQEVRQAKLSELRSHIGLVTQDVQLFHATIRDNLTFFNPDIADEDILGALDIVGLLPWYKAQEEGLDTMLGAGGEGLSAGQAQLLAFTRVLLTKPGLVILDEASSRLDPATEMLMEKAIDKLFRDRTGIIIAHRLSTLQRVDKILFLEDGKVLEYGDREALAKDKTSHFSYLLQVGAENPQDGIVLKEVSA